jgi:hypothetical protein
MRVVKCPRKVTNKVTLVISATNPAQRKAAVTIKSLATGVAALPVVGATAAGVTSFAPVCSMSPRVQAVVRNVPLPLEVGIADSEFRQAVAGGALPLAFNVANIRPAGVGAATADITASGPELALLHEAGVGA